MRIANVFSGRPMFYDRNPNFQLTFTFGSFGIGVHGLTVRSSYTIPTGRKAYLSAADAEMFRDGTATTAGHCKVQVNDSSAQTVVCFLVEFSTVIGTISQRALGANCLLAAGQILQLKTEDLSTGGTHEFNMSTSLTEFDV